MWSLICYGAEFIFTYKCPSILLQYCISLCPSALFYPWLSFPSFLLFCEAHKLFYVLIVWGVSVFASGKFCIHWHQQKKKREHNYNETDHMIDSSAVNDMSKVKHWTLYMLFLRIQSQRILLLWNAVNKYAYRIVFCILSNIPSEFLLTNLFLQAKWSTERVDLCLSKVCSVLLGKEGFPGSLIKFPFPIALSWRT